VESWAEKGKTKVLQKIGEYVKVAGKNYGEVKK